MRRSASDHVRHHQRPLDAVEGLPSVNAPIFLLFWVDKESFFCFNVTSRSRS
jgi:hypothetical protein